MDSVRSADGTTIAFERRGSGPALILVDPAGGYREFDHIRGLGKLLAASFTVYTDDRRGRGGSADTPPYAIEREVDDLAILIAEAGGSASVYAFSSGGLLALHAAAGGLPIDRLALFEPPIGTDEDRSADADFTTEIATLVAAGRRGDAVQHFLTSIGVPPEAIAQMGPGTLALEAVAHTLVYDCMIAEALPNGTHRSLAGEWHGVPDNDLAPVLAEFFLDSNPRRTRWLTSTIWPSSSRPSLASC
ncbi:MAG: alpha/beta fold hydrolase [Propionibacteriales bacterium]|nr:alpha/beta fold hydrolase [Propionibacteriales bacterium]